MAWPEARRRTIFGPFEGRPLVPITARLVRARRRAIGVGLVVVTLAATIGFGATVWMSPRDVTPASVGAPDTAASQAAPARGRQTVAVRTGSIASTIALDGRVGGATESALTFQTSGSVKSIPVAVGQLVDAGQLLAEIDSAPLQQDMVAARSQLEVSSLKLQQAQAQARNQDRETASRLQTQVDQTEASLRQAVADQARIAAGPSPDDVRQAESGVATAQSAAQRADSELAKLRGGPPPAELGLAEQQLASARLTLQRAQADQARLLAGPDAPSLQAAQQQVVQARVALQRAQADDAHVAAGPDPAAVRAAERDLATAQTTLLRAQAEMERVSHPDPVALAAAQRDVKRAEATLEGAKATKPSKDSRASQQAAVTSAQLTLQDAVAKRNQLQAGPAPWEVEVARRNLASARSAVDDAGARLEVAKQGADQLTIDAARAATGQAQLALDDAEAKLAALQSGPSDDAQADADDKVATARAAVTAAEARYATLRAGPPPDQISQAASAASAANLTLQTAAKRLSELRSHPTEDELRDAQSHVDAATAAVERARAEAAAPRREEDDPASYDRRLLTRAFEQDQAHVDALQRQITATRLEAPFAGVVAQIKAAVGGLADPSVPAVVLAAPGEQIVGSEVASSDSRRIAPGQTATVVVNDTAELKAEVASVADGPSPETQLVRLRVNWDGAAPTFGTPARVTVVTDARDQTLIVPQKAVRTVGTRRFVDVADGSAIKTTSVTTGLTANGMVEILDGVADGQLVVVTP